MYWCSNACRNWNASFPSQLRSHALNITDTYWLYAVNFNRSHTKNRSCTFFNVSHLQKTGMNYSSHYMENGTWPNIVAPVAACRTPRRRPLVSSEMEASATTTMIVGNQMCVQVQRKEISPEEYHNDAGWKLARERMSRLRQRTPDSGEPDGPGGSQTSSKSKFNMNVRASAINAARMPAMPLEESKIVVRPRGGLDIVKTGTTIVAATILAAAKITGEESAAVTICPNTQQNIMIVSTLNEDNAARYAKIQEIYIQGKPYEVSAYRTAPHDTVKGVIRGIPIDASTAELDRNIVNERNPLAVGTKRIGSMTTAIVVFQGPKEPNFVRYGVTLIPNMVYGAPHPSCCLHRLAKITFKPKKVAEYLAFFFFIPFSVFTVRKIK
ncbi:hypothetical protein V5799_031331 [Amblyomma americanum]|uniref:Uncharacterized protein n=1 Tax=Amblyomma americanum TaxID=6943 RepID=A0AAQ4EKQ5_AMBAM